MTKYKVTVYFGRYKIPTLIWRMEAVAVSVLIVDVVEKLRAWLDAKGMYLHKMNAQEWSMMLVTIHLGTVSISVDQESYDKPPSSLNGVDDE